MIKKFHPIKTLLKYSIPIVLLTILAATGTYFFISNKQSYSASILIQYTGKKAEKGLNPDDTPIDITELYSATIIDRVIDTLNLNCGVEEIRSSVIAAPVIPVTETKRETAAIELNAEYSFTPTKYLITYTADSTHSQEYAREVLDSILTEYYNFYSEKYIESVVYPNNALNISLDSYDYIECVELLRTNINSIATYCAARDNTFYSAKSGYSFIDLQLELEYLRDNPLQELNTYILENKLTTDCELLLQKEANNIAQYEIKIATTNDYISKQGNVIDQFAEKTLGGQASLDDVEDIGIITNVVDGEYDYKEASLTTYDILINNYISLMKEVNEYESKLRHSQRIAEAFSDNHEVEASDNAHLIAKEQLTEILDRFNMLYDSLVETAKSYYNVRSANYLSFNTNIRTVENLSVVLYVFLGGFAALVVSSCGFVVCDRMWEILHATSRRSVVQKTHDEQDGEEEREGEGNDEKDA